jgi:hypothetical protein
MMGEWYEIEWRIKTKIASLREKFELQAIKFNERGRGFL